MSRLSASLQENILLVLLFNDSKCQYIRNCVDESDFEGDYKKLVIKAYQFIDKYKKAPKEHIADLFEEELDKNDRHAKNLKNLIFTLYDQKDIVNVEYTLTKLNDFVTQQSIKKAVVAASEAIASGSEDANTEALEALQEALKPQQQVFEAGTRLVDDNALSFLDEPPEAFLCGIPELDKFNMGPARKELTLLLAASGAGKTWWLVHLAKKNMLRNKRIIHISLEMSEDRLAQRYLQSIFAVAKTGQKFEQTFFDVDVDGTVLDIELEAIAPKMSFDEQNFRKKIAKTLKRKKVGMNNLILKEFPSGSLTVQQLKAYLDTLEIRDNFVPDILIVDYPDIMKIRSDAQRQDIGRTVVELRGIGVARNCAVVAVSQLNRAGAKSKTATATDIAEDWSKVHTADNVFIYNQTEAEKSIGCARLLVAKARNDFDGHTILLSQQYRTGQFCVQSAMMRSAYTKIIEETASEVS